MSARSILTASVRRTVAIGAVLSLGLTTAAAAQEPAVTYGGFVDVGFLNSNINPPSHLFVNRGTTPRVDEWDLNMAGVYVKKVATDPSRTGFELTVHGGEDSKIFGFSSTASPIGGADFLLHLGPTNVSYLAPVGKGLAIQGGIFASLIGYDSLYAKDNFNYTRPWGADYTPYFMLGANASYPVTETVTVTGAVVNGYWHLANANSAPSVAGQLVVKATDAVTFKQALLYGSHQTNTALEFWRLLSDTIVERKQGALTVAVDYQLSGEKVDEGGTPHALWMAAQFPIHWIVGHGWSVTARPEFAWDRDGRWIAGRLGAGQSIKAFTGTLEYRRPYKGLQGIVKGEYRYDAIEGPGAGFPRQHLVTLGLILAVDR